MRIKKLPNGRYQVRWREPSKDKGKQVQRAKNFRTKELAQEHCRRLDRGEHLRADAPSTGRPLRDLVQEYQVSPSWGLLDNPTQLLYRRLFETWFDYILDTKIEDLTPKLVSDWLADMKATVNRYGRGEKRKNFRKELFLLRSLLKWYQGYKDDDDFVSPIRARHEEECWVSDTAYRASDQNFDGQVSDEIPLTDAEFVRFRTELLNGKFGEIVAVMADTQYDHSLRVSEVAALMWRDVDWAAKQIKFQRHVQYVHHDRSNNPDRIVPGLKNRKVVKRKGQKFERRKALSKTNPFFDRSSVGLKRLYLQAANKEGLVFRNPETGSFFTYRSIQNLYDRAFARAGLSYRGTHIVRYGGVNNFIEEFGADVGAAMELLGNESEGRYILKRPSKVAKLLSASKVHDDGSRV